MDTESPRVKSRACRRGWSATERLPRFCIALVLALGFSSGACRSSIDPRSVLAGRQSTTRAAKKDAAAQLRLATATGGLRGPQLIPVLDQVVPDAIEVEQAGRAELVVDGIRLVLAADGTFELGRGVLPLARTVQLTALPSRLGGGVLFSLSTPDSTWLLRSNSFTGPLLPVGRIDVPTTAITPGFEAIYATIKTTGLVVGVDPMTGQASESTYLPPAPEYGPVAIVDDWFGAYVDPLRGLMLSNDAGQNWRTLEDFIVSPRAMVAESWLNYGQDLRIAARNGMLEVELDSQRRIWISRDGSVRTSDEMSRSPSGTRSVRSWVQHWKHNEIGGWAIELAITQGALLDPEQAVFISRGRLARVRLRDGAVLESSETTLAPEKSCRALQAEGTVYFHCQSRTATSLHRLTSVGALERLAELVGQRSIASWSAAGIVLRGRCREGGPAAPGEYCVVRPSRDGESVQLTSPTGRERLVAIDQANVAVLTPPAEGTPGFLAVVSTRLGSSKEVFELTWPADMTAKQRRLLEQGYWHELAYSVGQELGFWVTHGDELLGVRLSMNGRATLGEIVGGAPRALITAERVLIPDSSGYALESKDGGMTYLRPPLPVTVASTLGAIPQNVLYYGCSMVGCRLGNWLRLGWTNSRDVQSDPELEPVTGPDPIRLSRRKRRIPRMRCGIEPGPVSAQREPEGALGLKSDDSSRHQDRLTSTGFRGFYAEAAPRLRPDQTGFDRGWRDESVAIRAYAEIPTHGDASTAWQLNLRVSDPLRRSSIWSVTETRVKFDNIEAAARAFSHPRYGARASSWSVLFDPGGDGALWTLDDAGKVRAFLLEPGRPVSELLELAGRTPRHISEVARLRDAWYVLGTDPTPSLIAVKAEGSRVVSAFDPRSRLRAARMRLVRNRDQTRIAYLAMSARLRAVDVEWFVYPIDVGTGEIEAPVVIPLAQAIRACDADEDGWLFATSLDLLAEVTLTSSGQEISGRTQGLLRLSGSGVCIDRVLVNGAAPQRLSSGTPNPPRRASVAGRHVDELGRLRSVACQILDE